MSAAPDALAQAVAHGHIYLVTNVLDGKFYVGMTTKTIEQRWKEHWYQHRRARGTSFLHRAMRKHGVDNFIIDEIVRAPIEQLPQLESTWIIVLGSKDSSRGYNLQDGGQCGGSGRKLSPATREKIAASRRGKKLSVETREKMSASHLGKPLSAAHIASFKGKPKNREGVEKIRAALKGRTPSLACRLAVAESNRRRARCLQ